MGFEEEHIGIKREGLDELGCGNITERKCLGCGIEFLGNGIEFLVSELNELNIRKESEVRRLGFICSNFLREPLVLSSSLTLTLLHWLFLPCFYY